MESAMLPYLKRRLRLVSCIVLTPPYHSRGCCYCNLVVVVALMAAVVVMEVTIMVTPWYCIVQLA